jgi:hypothetical protein
MIGQNGRVHRYRSSTWERIGRSGGGHRDAQRDRRHRGDPQPEGVRENGDVGFVHGYSLR